MVFPLAWAAAAAAIAVATAGAAWLAYEALKKETEGRQSFS
jgi:hypothetical protein